MASTTQPTEDEMINHVIRWLERTERFDDEKDELWCNIRQKRQLLDDVVLTLNHKAQDSKDRLLSLGVVRKFIVLADADGREEPRKALKLFSFISLARLSLELALSIPSANFQQFGSTKLPRDRTTTVASLFACVHVLCTHVPQKQYVAFLETMRDLNLVSLICDCIKEVGSMQPYGRSQSDDREPALGLKAEQVFKLAHALADKDPHFFSADDVEVILSQTCQCITPGKIPVMLKARKHSDQRKAIQLACTPRVKDRQLSCALSELFKMIAAMMYDKRGRDLEISLLVGCIHEHRDRYPFFVQYLDDLSKILSRCQDKRQGNHFVTSRILRLFANWAYNQPDISKLTSQETFMSSLNVCLQLQADVGRAAADCLANMAYGHPDIQQTLQEKELHDQVFNEATREETDGAKGVACLQALVNLVWANRAQAVENHPLAKKNLGGAVEAVSRRCENDKEKQRLGRVASLLLNVCPPGDEHFDKLFEACRRHCFRTMAYDGLRSFRQQSNASKSDEATELQPSDPFSTIPIWPIAFNADHGPAHAKSLLQSFYAKTQPPYCTSKFLSWYWTGSPRFAERSQADLLHRLCVHGLDPNIAEQVMTKFPEWATRLEAASVVETMVRQALSRQPDSVENRLNRLKGVIAEPMLRDLSLANVLDDRADATFLQDEYVLHWIRHNGEACTRAAHSHTYNAMESGSWELPKRLSAQLFQDYDTPLEGNEVREDVYKAILGMAKSADAATETGTDAPACNLWYMPVDFGTYRRAKEDFEDCSHDADDGADLPAVSADDDTAGPVTTSDHDVNQDSSRQAELLSVFMSKITNHHGPWPLIHGEDAFCLYDDLTQAANVIPSYYGPLNHSRTVGSEDSDKVALVVFALDKDFEAMQHKTVSKISHWRRLVLCSRRLLNLQSEAKIFKVQCKGRKKAVVEYLVQQQKRKYLHSLKGDAWVLTWYPELDAKNMALPIQSQRKPVVSNELVSKEMGTSSSDVERWRQLWVRSTDETQCILAKSLVGIVAFARHGSKVSASEY